MKGAIIGSSGVGKSTLFKLLTGVESRGGKGYISGIGQAILYDRRVEELSRIYNPRKTTHATLEINDFDGFGRLWKEEKTGEIVQTLNQYDVLLHVTTGIRDFEEIEYRLLLSDLRVVEKRLEMLKKVGREKDAITLFEKLKEHLESEKPISSFPFSEQDKQYIQNFTFATAIPRVVIYNIMEGQEPDTNFIEYLKKKGILFNISNLLLEVEALSLSGDERRELIKEYGFEPAFERIIENIKKALNIIAFLTAGEKEVRAWIIRKGLTVKQAAGKIHSDLERGFVRAEVIHYDEFMKVGNMKRAREQGMVRLEGKDYIVQDGDIILIRSSI